MERGRCANEFGDKRGNNARSGAVSFLPGEKVMRNMDSDAGGGDSSSFAPRVDGGEKLPVHVFSGFLRAGPLFAGAAWVALLGGENDATQPPCVAARSAAAVGALAGSATGAAVDAGATGGPVTFSLSIAGACADAGVVAATGVGVVTAMSLEAEAAGTAAVAAAAASSTAPACTLASTVSWSTAASSGTTSFSGEGEAMPGSAYCRDEMRRCGFLDGTPAGGGPDDAMPAGFRTEVLIPRRFPSLLGCRGAASLCGVWESTMTSWE